jgi:hypothetical protein
MKTKLGKTDPRLKPTKQIALTALIRRQPFIVNPNHGMM